MPRQRKLLGKRPGGNFAGVPGNLGSQRGWEKAFQKMGPWGILNPSEWAGYGKRQGLVESVLRPQYSLQEVISNNMDLEAEIARQRSASAKSRVSPSPIIPPTTPGQPPARTPSSSSPKAPVGAKPTLKAPAAPKATPAAAKAVAAKPAPAAPAKPALKVPQRRAGGRTAL